tara:strand:- start:32723 stop:33088 length:366 start_codon:yes stop_codon:yes gene_type:complete
LSYEFKILTLSNDASFSISLVTECNKYGFSLIFIDDKTDIENEINNNVITVALFDLSDSRLNSFKFGERVKLDYGIPIFGLLNEFDKNIQKKARDHSFDLIFTKKMLLKSIKEVVIHVSKE